MPPDHGQPRPLPHTDDLPAAGHTPLHAPWRESWIRHIAAQEKAARDQTPKHDPQDTPGTPATPASSFLREYWLHPERDQQNHVIVRTGTETPDHNDHNKQSNDQPTGGLILLNAYPYAGGHLLVALGDGRPRLTDYSEAQRREFWSLVDLATHLCETVLEPQGLNIGLNIGRAGGAGVPAHIHAHVIPRWIGDTNFLAAAGQTRLVNAPLERFTQLYRDEWQRIKDNANPTTSP